MRNHQVENEFMRQSEKNKHVYYNIILEEVPQQTLLIYFITSFSGTYHKSFIMYKSCMIVGNNNNP